jgi:ATP adenylyltransferase
MEKLWAPWRMEYISQTKPKGCIFCVKPAENRDKENLIIKRGENCFIILNFYPYNNGHLMIVPYRHLADLSDLTAEEKMEMMDLMGRSADILKKALKAEGINIGMNMGRTAGAGIDDHLHFHMVPRWNGDTNFMPIVGHTKVISQGLFAAYDALKPHYET